MTFYHAVMRPVWSDLEHTRDATRLWQRSQRRFTANVLGPHLEHLARYWTRHLAAPELLGDYPSVVGSGTVNDPAHRTTHELDVIAFGLGDDDRQTLLAIGEVKWGETMGLPHLDRLRHLRDLLAAQGRHGAAGARLVCYGGGGFTSDLVEAADEDDAVVLVTVDALYRPAGDQTLVANSQRS